MRSLGRRKELEMEGQSDTVEVVTGSLREGLKKYWQNPIVNEDLDLLRNDFLGIHVIDTIYQRLIESDVSGEEVVEYFFRIAQNLANVYGLDWGAILERVGTVEDYFEDIRKSLADFFPGGLAPDWKKRVAVFDFIGTKLPLLISYVFRGIDSPVASKGLEIKTKIGGEKTRLLIHESHAKLFKIYGVKFEGEMVEGVPVVWPIANREKARLLVKRDLPLVIQNARKLAEASDGVSEGLSVLNGMILVDGSWCYASNTMEIGGGSYVYMGVDHGHEDSEPLVEALTSAMGHELDHLGYMASRMKNGRQLVMFSGLVMELRGRIVESLVESVLHDREAPEELRYDLEKYGFILTASREQIQEEIDAGGWAIKPVELYYPSDKFGGGTWKDWATIFEVLVLGLPLGNQKLAKKS